MLDPYPRSAAPAAEPVLPAASEAALAELLERVWGFAAPRPLQREAMAAILAGRDSLVVLPTGGGKSLCYQAPALLPAAAGGPPGVAVVVSPLISLMKDQVDSLRQNGVAAASIDSTQAPAERERRLRDLREGRTRLLYVSPERLVGDDSEGFRRQLATCGVRYFAIDEAHCISQWGHDFRPVYRQLSRLRDGFPGIGVHAYTATATPRVRRDIASQLGLVAPQVLIGDFDRPNLVYRALRRTDPAAQLRAVLERHPDEAGIVYCLSRREVEATAERLQGWGFRALPYHAGLDDAVRHRNQEEFLQERVDVVVATVAFGMGIDRSNVRYVVHTAAPRSLEGYQQESGRAGRDGLPAECVLLFSGGDFVTWRRMLAQEQAGGDEPRWGRPAATADPATALQLLRAMEGFAGATRCRHRILVEYFGQTLPAAEVAEGTGVTAIPAGPGCGACDWCLGELERIAEPLVVAQKILSCVLRVGQRFGTMHVVDVLRGRAVERVLRQGHEKLSTFGLLADCPVDELRGYVEQLVDGGHLLIDGEPYPILQVTERGRSLLRGQEELPLFRQARPPQRPSRKKRGERARTEEAGEDWAGVDRELFAALRERRRELARERAVPPYVIFHDTTLRELARQRPRSPEALRRVHGVGENKARDLGPAFLEVITNWQGGGDS